MPVACQSRAGTEPAGETQSLLLRQSETVASSGAAVFLCVSERKNGKHILRNAARLCILHRAGRLFSFCYCSGLRRMLGTTSHVKRGDSQRAQMMLGNSDCREAIHSPYTDTAECVLVAALMRFGELKNSSVIQIGNLFNFQNRHLLFRAEVLLLLLGREQGAD